MNNIALLFGLLTIEGGVIGYTKAGSTASLIAGSVSGSLLIMFTLLYMKQKLWAVYGILGVSVLLFARFITPFLATYAMMPAGIMVILSAVTIVGFLPKVFPSTQMISK